MTSDKKLARISRFARYTFVLLITQADDDGLVRAEPRQLLGALYPHDEEAVGVADLADELGELADIGVIRWRETKDGMAVIQIVNWTEHQLIKNRSKPFLLNQLTEGSVEPPPALRRVSVDPPVRSLEPRVLSPEPRAQSPDSFAAQTGEPDRKNDLNELMGAIRKVGYRKATTRRDEMRDYSVAKSMLASHPVETCLDAIEGTRKLVGESEHFTLRLVWAEGKDGGPPMFTRALDAVAKPASRAEKRERTQPTALTDDMDRILKKMGAA